MDVEEIQTNSLRSAKLRRQAEMNDDNDPKILSVIAENEEDIEAPNNVDVMQSINPIAFQQRRPKSPSNPRPVSSPPLLESFSLNDDVQTEETNLNKIVVVVEVNSTETEDKAVEGTDFQKQYSNSITASKPRSLVIEANPESSVRTSEQDVPVEETGIAESVKEYHLQVKSS